MTNKVTYGVMACLDELDTRTESISFVKLQGYIIFQQWRTFEEE